MLVIRSSAAGKALFGGEVGDSETREFSAALTQSYAGGITQWRLSCKERGFLTAVKYVGSTLQSRKQY